MNKMYELRDMLCEELDNITEQGEITTGSLDIINKLTHSIKSIDTIIAMEEASYDGSYRDGSYYDGYSRRGSYARGRRNARRDSRGRYSRTDSKEHIAEQLEDIMDETADPTVKQALQKALSHIEA